MSTLLSTFGALSILLFPISAAQAAGFTVAPMIQEVVLDEGETAETYTTTVTNETGALATFELSVIDFGSLDESGGVAFVGATGTLEEKYALASWMQPETSELTVGPGETRAVKVRIENRESLSPGGHYGALVFKNTSAVRPDAPNVAINQIFSSLVLVKKTGGAKYGLALAALNHPDRWFSLDRAVTARFQNPGNVHVVPRGEVRVTDPLGRLVYRGVLNEGSAIILPETFREYPFKLFSVERAFIPGRYSLDFSYRYDGREEKELWSKQFFYFPPLSSIAMAGTAAGIGLFFWFRRKRARGGAASA
jgi:hypothetical protein